MRTDALSAILPDLSARIMRDVLCSNHVNWQDFCQTYDFNDVFARGSAELSAETELSLQRGFFEAMFDSPDVWVELGLRYRAPGYGAYGIAMMTADTLGDVFRNSARYQALTYSLIEYRFVPGLDGSGFLIGTDASLFGRFREFTQLRDLGSVNTFLKDLVGDAPILQSIQVAAAAPPNWQRMRHAFPCPIVFDADRTEWRFLPGAADTPVTMADTNLFAANTLLCARQLQRSTATLSIAERLSEMLRETTHWVPSMTDAAKHMGMSERTLHRRLRDEGHSLQSLVDHARSERAKVLISQRHMSLTAIAAHLGFSDASSLSRAFRRWTGGSIKRFRESAVAVSPGGAISH